MAVAFVTFGQFVDWTSTTHTSVATGAFAVGAGQFIIVVYSQVVPISMTDTAGNTYIPVTIPGTGFTYWYAKNAIANATNVLTVTFNTASSFVYVVASVYSGADLANPIDTAVATAFGAFPAVQNGNTPNFTTRWPQEAVHAWAISSDTIPGVGAGYTNIVNPAAAEQVEWQQLTTVQTLNATVTFTTLANWGMAAVAIVGAGQRPASAGQDLGPGFDFNYRL